MTAQPHNDLCGVWRRLHPSQRDAFALRYVVAGHCAVCGGRCDAAAGDEGTS